MNRILFFLFCLLLTASGASAQNPIIRDQFAADPTARLFDGRVYLYPSHDIVAPAGQRQDWFCMEDYHVFSSVNLTEWTDHGVILRQQDVPWGKADGFSMWAPDCVRKDGRYYFYFPDAPKEGRGFAVGVATSTSPTGPFICEPEPIKGVTGIDPCVLIDDDGSAYIYWSSMGLRGARLKDNMKEIEGQMQEVQAPRREGAPAMPTMTVGGLPMEGLPEGFKEGPFAFKRDGRYYLTFPWVRHEGGTETLAYAMSDSPLGPWTFKGIIMREHPDSCWTNHHSIINYGGEWLLFYHHNDYSPDMDKRRSPRIDRLHFNTDGTIREVTPTLRGVGSTPATARIDIDRYSSASRGVTTAFVDSTDTFRGWFATLPTRGSWLEYDDVDFTAIADAVPQGAYVTASVRAQANSTVTLRLGGPKGTVLARLDIRVESQGQYRRSYRGQWLTVTASLVGHLTDAQLRLLKDANIKTSIAAVCEGAAVDIDWVQFKQREEYYVPATAEAAEPDAEGFIRHWLLLEPIEKPNRSNTVFTDTYLRENLVPQHYVETLPHNGQRIHVNGQRLTWHAIESLRPNVKLFRFAEQQQAPLYGVVFWVFTVIDCDEDIRDVRLAVGSNSASRWWLNGEEVLLMSGDRRMVRDDAVSKRITLHRGRNILRGAVINGPGMSDFCARFINEQGKPVRRFRLKLE